jgi:hypothetical protein
VVLQLFREVVLPLLLELLNLLRKRKKRRRRKKRNQMRMYASLSILLTF